MSGANVNGIDLNAADYKQYDKLQDKVWKLEDPLSPKTKSLEQQIKTEILDDPNSILRRLLWSLLQHHLHLFSPAFAAQVYLLALSGLSESPESWTPALAVASAMQQPITVQNAILTQLQTIPQASIPTERREHYAQVEQSISRRTELDEQAAEPTPVGLDVWVAAFLLRVHSGALRANNPQLPPLPPTEQQPALFRKLLGLTHAAGPEDAESDHRQDDHNWHTGLELALTPLLASPLSDQDKVLAISQLVAEQETPLDNLMHAHRNGYDLGLQKIVKEQTKAGKLPVMALAALRRTLLKMYQPNPELKWVNDMKSPELNPGEAWSDAVLAKLDALPANERAPWPALFDFARSATTGKPATEWLAEAQKHIDTVGAANFHAVLLAALPLLSKPRTFPLQPTRYGPDPNLKLDAFNAMALKGLLWMLPLVTDAALSRQLSGVVESALKKVPGLGPRAPKIANAAVYALSQIESEAALSALARLASTITFKGTIKEVQKALELIAKRLNVTPDDLLDMGVPSLGLSSVGQRLDVLGDTEAQLLVDANGAHLSFSKGGKPLKSVPAAVKKDFKEELADLKATQKEAEKNVSALTQRLDSLMIQPKTWPGAAWLERYLNHPLSGTVARRLIWLVDGVATLYADGELRDLSGKSVEVRPGSEVKLWHPIGRDVDEVLGWRDRLEGLQIKQPFKQAWREVYVLTDAERRTDTYSNRFAGHILKQHQFHALAALRGWHNKLRLMVDASYAPAMRSLPAYGIRAEYWIEGVGENYGEDTTDSGSFLRLATDQVRFYPIDAPENIADGYGGGYTQWVNENQQPTAPLHMADIPPLVLSEILRDVDLFVGVASVGNDPTWQDGGPGGRFREYWQGYSFGELNETAKTRAEYLKRLIPRLKIKDRLELDGRFLKVRGDRRTYKIHLGSSNILMEPNDQYLCIIPGSKNSGPEVDFDGDRVLSLVLSKAFLLADDTKISDPVILQQLGR